MAENGTKTGGGVEILDRPAEKLQHPDMFVVFVHNDPYTPREFVVGVLTRFFQKTEEQATRIMITAHTHGMGAVGVYTKEMAETKAHQANTYSRSEGRPLHFSIQEES